MRSIQPPGTTSSARAALEVDEEAGELHEQREGDEDADERDPVVAEHGVGERRAAEAGRDRGEQDDRAVLGEAAADEPVRGVVLAALVDRAALDARARSSTSAVSRIGTARTSTAAAASRPSSPRPSSSSRGRARRA